MNMQRATWAQRGLPCRTFWSTIGQSRCLSLAFNLHQPSHSSVKPRNEPIIVLHGLFGSKQNNRSISKALARDLNSDVYALDLRNHGDSPHDTNHSYMTMADDVEQFIEKHDLSPVTLIGHSMGAKVAMTLAIRSPEKVSNLIPVDNAPVDAVLKTDFHKYIRGMRKILDANISKQSEADQILAEFEDSLLIRQFLLTNLLRDPESQTYMFRVPLKTLGDALDNMGDFPYRNPLMNRYQGPTLMVRGTKSHYIADDVLPVVGQFFPMFQLVDINCGHWVISEQPEAFRKAVVDFLQNRD